MNLILKTAVATAIAAAGVTAAQALDVKNYATNTNVNVFISGSTAVDTTLLSTLILGTGGYCQSGTIDVYQIGSPTNRMIYCSATAASGLTAGTPLAIFKESNVGSGNGVGPLISVAKGGSSGIFFLSPAALVADTANTECTTAAVISTANFLAYTNHTACPAVDITASTVVPTGGFADVEAALLRGAGGTTYSAADVSKYLQSQNVFDVVWGVAVTKNLFYALQAAEIGVTGNCPANSDLSSCAPSLSKAQVASLYQGNVFTWDQLGLNNAVDNNVYICRRDIESGTEASFEAYFLGARCSQSSEVMATSDNQFIFTNGSGGGMRNCLSALNSGGSFAPFNDTTSTALPPVTEPGSQWAIGLISSEVTSGNLSADTFRLVAVDGVLPTLSNVVNGFYPYWSSNFAYSIKSGTGVPTGSAATVWTNLSKFMGDPAPTKAVNTAYSGRPWGNGGDLSPAVQFITATNTLPATSASVALSPVNAFTKASSGSVNNCDTPVLYFPGATAGYSLKTPTESVLLGTGNVNH